MPTTAPPAEVRLVDRIERPMAYVAIDAGARGETGAEVSPLQRILGEPALEALSDDPAAMAAFAFVRGVLARATGEVELAVLGVVPSSLLGRGEAALPLLVVRARLSANDAARMRDVLADEEFARPHRTVHGHPTWSLRHAADRANADPANADRAGDSRGAGLEVEVAVVGADLVVANHARGLEEALDARGAVGRDVLARDPRHQQLLAELQPPAGALRVFADWRRLGRRLASLGGLSGALLGWSGLGGADAVAATVTADEDDALRTTVLLSLPADAALDGWLGLVEPAPARQLVEELPVGGLGGLVFAVEPVRVASAASQAGGFCSAVRGGCGEHGLDLDRIVRRLGRRGALQMLLLSGNEATAVPAFALQAQSRRAATEIVAEIAGAIQPPASGRSSDRGPTAVDLRDVGGLERLRLGVVDDLLVFAQEAGTVDALAAARRERGRASSRLDAAISRALRAFGADRGTRIGGLVHVDISGWLELVGVDEALRSTLPAQQTGFVDVLRGSGREGVDPVGTVVRLQLLGAR
ncbi:MAG: hypothetical protein AB7O97_10125 [Planctomycetota bacterium]